MLGEQGEDEEKRKEENVTRTMLEAGDFLVR